jgi:hypothetical protein
MAVFEVISGTRHLGSKAIERAVERERTEL